MTVVVDTSALFGLLDQGDNNHKAAAAYWRGIRDVDLVTHGYLVAEAISLVRHRLGWPAVDALLDDIVPALRVEMVDRGLHDRAVGAYRAERGSTSFVDRVTIEFARLHRIKEAFAFDPDLEQAGLRFPTAREGAP